MFFAHFQTSAVFDPDSSLPRARSLLALYLEEIKYCTNTELFVFAVQAVYTVEVRRRKKRVKIADLGSYLFYYE